MKRFGADGPGPQLPRRSIVIMAAAMLVASAVACSPATHPPSVAISPSAATNAAQLLPTSSSPSPSRSPASHPASADLTSLRWVNGGRPGVSAATTPGVDQEFYVFGWSEGYLGFTSAFVRATGKMQSLRVTSSPDGIHWRTAGRLPLGHDDSAVIVTQVVEGPSGLLATAERVGCAWQKPAVRMWRSTGGAAWAPVDIEKVFGADTLPGVSGGSAGYIVLAAAGGKRTVWTSQDGASWHERAVPSGGFSPQSVASFQRGLILAGTTQVAPPDCGATTGDTAARYTGSVWLSQEGSSWSEADLPNVLEGTETTMSVDRLNDTTVLVEEVAVDDPTPDGVVRDWTSSDGLTWQQSDVLAAALGDPVTDDTRTIFVGATEGDGLEIWGLTHDMRPTKLSAGADAPITYRYGLVGLGPAGLLVTDASGAHSWLGVPVR